jgi:ribosomal protein S9
LYNHKSSQNEKHQKNYKKPPQKNAIAVAHCKLSGAGVLKINGHALETIVNQTLKTKIMEPLYILGLQQFEKLDIRVKVTGGGVVSQAYAVRQAIAKAVVAAAAKKDEVLATQLKTTLLAHDRTLLVADNRRRESKHFGGPGARARQQKSYR